MPGLENKKEGKYDFDGAWVPTQNSMFYDTFSVGIFKWLPYASGRRKGLKRGKVIYRVRGKVCDAEKVYSRAREMCAIFDKDPDWTVMKSETIK